MNKVSSLRVGININNKIKMYRLPLTIVNYPVSFFQMIYAVSRLL